MQTQSAERSGLITQEQLKDVTLKGRDYMGMLQLLPGVVDTQNREAPGWNNLGGLSINGGRNNTINLTYDGVTNLDTGSNTGPVPRAGPRFDRRDQGADLELPGRVRPQLRRHHQRHHEERQPRLPRRRLLLEARRQVQRQRVAEQQGQPRQAALQVRLQRLSHRRTGRAAEFQQRPQQAVLLLEPGVPAAHQSRDAQPPDDADRARAARRLLADRSAPTGS